jgi:hypothetical protein
MHTQWPCEVGIVRLVLNVQSAVSSQLRSQGHTKEDLKLLPERLVLENSQALRVASSYPRKASE